MTNTNLTNIRIKSLYVLDQDEAVDFYCGKLGFVVADDVDLGFMRWLTVSLPHDPDHQLLLELPGGPTQDAETAAQLRDLLTKGALGGTFLTSDDVAATFEQLQAAGVEIVQEPVEQPYGTDMAIRDPFGNHVRISQMAPVSAEEVQRRYDAAQA